MNNHTRLQQAHADYDFYLSVGDYTMAEFARERWVHLNFVCEGAQHVA